MPEARKHHYVPRSYLAAWTDTGTKDGQLLVLDKQTGKDWPVRPINAANEKDLYLIDVSEAEGVAPNEIENTFATIEGAAVPVLKRLLAGEDMPGGGDLENVLAFVTVLALRVPARLDWTDNAMRSRWRSPSNDFGRNAIAPSSQGTPSRRGSKSSMTPARSRSESNRTPG
jgi:hypothetical protein